MKGKTRSRSMPVHDELRHALSVYIGHENLEFSGFYGWFLFHRQGKNRPISRQLAWQILQDSADVAGVSREHLGCHSMRKTFASAVYNSPLIGGDIAKMAKLLGHTNPTNTLSYIQFLDESLEGAVLSQ